MAPLQTDARIDDPPRPVSLILCIVHHYPSSSHPRLSPRSVTAAECVVTRSTAIPYPEDIPEGSSQNYDIRMQAAPNEAVDIAVTAHNETIQVAPSGLVFNSSTWNITQTITVFAIDDDAKMPSPYMAMFSVFQTSRDQNFNGARQEYTVTIEDNDKDTSLLQTFFTWKVKSATATAVVVEFTIYATTVRDPTSTYLVGNTKLLNGEIDFGDGSSRNDSTSLIVGLTTDSVATITIVEHTYDREPEGMQPMSVSTVQCCRSLGRGTQSTLETVLDLDYVSASPIVGYSTEIYVARSTATRFYLPVYSQGNPIAYRLATSDEYGSTTIGTPHDLTVDAVLGLVSWDTEGVQPGRWFVMFVVEDLVTLTEVMIEAVIVVTDDMVYTAIEQYPRQIVYLQQGLAAGSAASPAALFGPLVSSVNASGPLPTGATLDASGTLHWTPSNNQVGGHIVCSQYDRTRIVSPPGCVIYEVVENISVVDQPTVQAGALATSYISGRDTDIRAVAFGSISTSGALVQKMTVQLGGVHDGGQELIYFPASQLERLSVTATTPGTNTIIVEGVGSATAYTDLLTRLQYAHSSGRPTLGDRTIIISVETATGISSAATQVLTVAVQDVAPAFSLDSNTTGTGFRAMFFRNGPSVSITGEVLVVDDDSDISSATLQLSPVPDAPEEVIMSTYTSPPPLSTPVAVNANSVGLTFGVSPAPRSVSHRIAVNNTGTVGDVDVVVDIKHSAVGELTVTLSHAGIDVVLTTSPGGITCVVDDMHNTMFTEDAMARLEPTQSSPGSCVALTKGAYKPFGSLHRLRATPVAGDWTLRIEDSNGLINAGQLDNWGLVISTDTGDWREQAAQHFVPGVGVSTPGIKASRKFSIEVPGKVVDMAVHVQMDASEASNLHLNIVHPDGTSVALIDRDPTCSESFPGELVFTDQATAHMPQCGSTPAVIATGMMPSASPLSALNGKRVNGIWKVEVELPGCQSHITALQRLMTACPKYANGDGSGDGSGDGHTASTTCDLSEECTALVDTLTVEQVMCMANGNTAIISTAGVELFQMLQGDRAICGTGSQCDVTADGALLGKLQDACPPDGTGDDGDPTYGVGCAATSRCTQQINTVAIRDATCFAAVSDVNVTRIAVIGTACARDASAVLHGVAFKFRTEPNCNAAYDTATGALVFTGVDTADMYQSVLDTIVYRNLNSEPNGTSREVLFTITDTYGLSTSNVAEVSIHNLNTFDLPSISEDVYSPESSREFAFGLPIVNASTFTDAYDLIMSATPVEDRHGNKLYTDSPQSSTKWTTAGTPKGLGVAITAVDNDNGQWQFSIDAGLNWTDIDASTLLPTAAVILASEPMRFNVLRFMPDLDFHERTWITFVVWEMNGLYPTGSEGADSTIRAGTIAEANATAYLKVDPINDSPIVVNHITVPVTELYVEVIEEDTAYSSNDGVLVQRIIAHDHGNVAGIVDGNYTDIDRATPSGANAIHGIAVTGVEDNYNSGDWEWSIDGGETWYTFRGGHIRGTTIPVSRPQLDYATVLSADSLTRIRFSPNPNYNTEFDLNGDAYSGNIPHLQYKGWDNTTTDGVYLTNGQYPIDTVNADGTFTNPFSKDVAKMRYTVASLNDEPSIAVGTLGSGGDHEVAYLEDHIKVNLVDTAALSISDPDDAQVSLLSIVLTPATDGYNETMEYAMPASLSSSLNLDGDVLTLTFRPVLGNRAPIGDYSAVLQSLTYRNSLQEPTPGQRTVTFSVVDTNPTDDARESNTVSASVTLVAFNDVPDLNITRLTTEPVWTDTYFASFVENGGPTPIVDRSNVAIRDHDNSTMSALTVVLINPLDGPNETLACIVPTTATGVTATYVGGTLSIVGEASKDDYVQIVQSLTYANSRYDYDHGDPTPGTRTIELTLSDGDKDSLVATVQMTFAQVNDEPYVDLNGPASANDFAVEFTEEQGSVALVSPNMIVFDIDNATLEWIDVIITDAPDGADEALTYSAYSVNQLQLGGAVVSIVIDPQAVYNPATRTLRIEGLDSVAEYLAILKTIRYNNVADEPNDATREVTFTASDGLLTSAVRTTSVAVTMVNDSPRISQAAIDTHFSDFGTNEDDVSTFSLNDLFNHSDIITDDDPGPIRGIAISAADSTSGTWQYQVNLSAGWVPLIPSPESALLVKLADDEDTYVRFMPNQDFFGTTSFSVNAWDGFATLSMSTYNIANLNSATDAFSSETGLVRLTVAPINDKPIITLGTSFPASTFLSIDEDSADPANTSNTVANLIDSINVTDVDMPSGGTYGIAVLAVNDENGEWQYSVDQGNSFTRFGAVSSTSAVVLRRSGIIRFVSNHDYNAYFGLSEIQFVAWDLTDGRNSGDVQVDVTPTVTGPYGAEIATATITVNPINDRPVMSNGNPNVFIINEEEYFSEGESITAFLPVPSTTGATPLYTDVDIDFVLEASLGRVVGGIAVVGVLDRGHGTWEWVCAREEANNVIQYQPFSMSETAINATLLSRDCDVRFRPDEHFNSELDQNGNPWATDMRPTLVFKAWDKNGATSSYEDGRFYIDTTVVPDGGVHTSPFSANSIEYAVQVTSINDAPTIEFNAPLVASDFAATPQVSYITSYVEDQGDVGPIRVDISIVDVDDYMLKRVVVHIADATDADRNEMWVVPNGSHPTKNFTQTFDVSTNAINLVIAPSDSDLATLSSFRQALLDLRYRIDIQEPTGGPRLVTIWAVDDNEAMNSASFQLNVVPFNDVPDLNVTTGDQSDTYFASFVENGGPTPIVDRSNVAIRDHDNSTMSALTVVLINPLDGPNETLACIVPTTATGVTATYVGGTLSIVGEASKDDYVQIVQSLTYANSRYDYDHGDPTPGTRTIELTLSDGDKDSLVATVQMTFAQVNDEPYVDLNGPASANDFAVEFTEEQGSVALVSPNMIVFDIDNATLEWIDVIITDAPDGADEALTYSAYSVNQLQLGGAVVSIVIDPQAVYNPATRTLRIEGLDSVAEYLAILKTIRYNNVADEPNDATREVTFTASDGLLTSAVRTTSVAVTMVNDAPALNESAVLTPPTIVEDVTRVNNSGVPVGVMLNSFNTFPIVDDDANASFGIAIVDPVSPHGEWQFSVNNGNTWQTMLLPITGTSVLLLGIEDVVRFLPHQDFNGIASFTFRAWDQTFGMSGTLADIDPHSSIGTYSVVAILASFEVLPVNDAPFLVPVSYITANDIDEDFSEGLTNVSDIVSAASITDVDTFPHGIFGIAVTSVDDTNGIWQFSVDLGVTFQPFGAVSVQNAVVLQGDASVRFVPHLDYHGIAVFQFAAWDETDLQTHGQGSEVDATISVTAAYSAAQQTVIITVNPVNDRPISTGAGGQLLAIFEDDFNNSGTLVSDMLEVYTDRDEMLLPLAAADDSDCSINCQGSVCKGIAVTAVDRRNGDWFWRCNASLTYTRFIGGRLENGQVFPEDPSPAEATLLSDCCSVKFVPSPLFNTFNDTDGMARPDSDTPSITYKLWDRFSAEYQFTSSFVDGNNIIRDSSRSHIYPENIWPGIIAVNTESEGSALGSDSFSAAETRSTITIVSVNNPPVLVLANVLRHSIAFVENAAPVSLVTSAFNLTDVDNATFDQLTITLEGVTDPGYESIDFATAGTGIVVDVLDMGAASCADVRGIWLDSQGNDCDWYADNTARCSLDVQRRQRREGTCANLIITAASLDEGDSGSGDGDRSGDGNDDSGDGSGDGSGEDQRVRRRSVDGSGDDESGSGSGDDDGGSGSSDATEPTEFPWQDSRGNTCEWYAEDTQRCSIYGPLYNNWGFAASEACCACGSSGGSAAPTPITSARSSLILQIIYDGNLTAMGSWERGAFRADTERDVALAIQRTFGDTTGYNAANFSNYPTSVMLISGSIIANVSLDPRISRGFADELAASMEEWAELAAGGDEYPQLSARVLEGTFANADGLDATGACCACGGGHRHIANRTTGYTIQDSWQLMVHSELLPTSVAGTYTQRNVISAGPLYPWHPTSDAARLSYRELLGLATYTNSHEEPQNNSRTITVTVEDGSGDVVTEDVTVEVFLLQENRPRVETNRLVLHWQEGEPAVPAVPEATIYDADHNELFPLTALRVYSQFAPCTVLPCANVFAVGDVLDADVSGYPSLSKSYDSETGMLQITGRAPASAYQSVLRSVTYVSEAEEPLIPFDYSTANTWFRTFAIVATDSVGLESETKTFIVAAYPINDQMPTVSTSQQPYVLLEDQEEQVVLQNIVLSDTDSADLPQQSVMLQLNSTNGNSEYLMATSGANVSVRWNASERTLVLTGPATVVDFNTVLAGVTYINTAEEPGALPSGSARTVTVTLNDNAVSEAVVAVNNAANYTHQFQITISMVDDTSFITVPASSAVEYIEGSAPVILFVGADVGGVDEGLRVTSGAQHCVVTDNCVTDGAGNYSDFEECSVEVLGSGVLNAVLFDLEASSACGNDYILIGGIRYCGTTGPSNLAVDANTSITWSTDTSVVGAGFTICWAPATSSGSFITDYDSPLLQELEVKIVQPVADGAYEALSIEQAVPSWATVTGDGTGALRIFGAGSIAEYTALLNAITFAHTDANPGNPTAGERTISVRSYDGNTWSLPASITTVVVPVNDAPILSNVAHTVTFVEETEATLIINSAFNLSDVDSVSAQRWGGALIANPADYPEEGLTAPGIDSLSGVRLASMVSRCTYKCEQSLDASASAIACAADCALVDALHTTGAACSDTCSTGYTGTIDCLAVCGFVGDAEQTSWILFEAADDGDLTIFQLEAALKLVRYHNTKDEPVWTDRQVELFASDRFNHSIASGSSMTVQLAQTNDLPRVVLDLTVRANTQLGSSYSVNFAEGGAPVALFNDNGSSFDVVEDDDHFNVGFSALEVTLETSAAFRGEYEGIFLSTGATETRDYTGLSRYDQFYHMHMGELPGERHNLEHAMNITSFATGGIASLSLLDALIKNLRYVNLDHDPVSGSVRTIKIVIRDAAGLASAPEYATITIIARNDAPMVDIAEPIQITVNEDTDITFDVLDRFRDDTDDFELGADLIITGVNSTLRISQAPVPYGTVRVSANSNDSIVFSPQLNDYGFRSFQVQACDYSGLCSADVTINVSVVPVEDPPYPNPDITDFCPAAITCEFVDNELTVHLVEDAELLSFDLHPFFYDVEDYHREPFWPDQDANLSITQSPNNAFASRSLSCCEDQRLTFTPVRDFVGRNTLLLDVTDSGGTASEIAIVFVVANVNDVPTFVTSGLTHTVQEDAISASLAVELSDVEDGVEGLNTSAVIVSGPSHGQAEIFCSSVPNPLVPGSIMRSCRVLYTPTRDYNGVDTITLMAVDATGANTTADMTITVVSVLDNPFQTQFTVHVEEDVPYSFSLIDLFSYPDASLGDAKLLASQIRASSSNTVQNAQPDGYDRDRAGYTYTPFPHFTGNDTFAVDICAPQACDNNPLFRQTFTVTVEVAPVNDLPEATSITLSMYEDNGTAVADVWSEVTDVDIQALPKDSITFYRKGHPQGPSIGDVSYNTTTGFMTYTPDLDKNGIDEFFYTVCDQGNTTCSLGQVTVDVLPVNDRPVGIASFTFSQVHEDGYNLVLGYGEVFTDPDIISTSSIMPMVSGDTPELLMEVITPALHAQLTPYSRRGHIGYHPDHDFVGQDNFTIRVCDTCSDVRAPIGRELPIECQRQRQLYPGFIGDPGCFETTVFVRVLNVNDPPIAPDLSMTLLEGAQGELQPYDFVGDVDDTQRSFILSEGLEPLDYGFDSVLGTLANIDNSSLRIESFPATESGSAEIVESGTVLQFTPLSGFRGYSSLTYIVCDIPQNDMPELCSRGTVHVRVTTTAPVITGAVAVGACFESASQNPSIDFMDDNCVGKLDTDAQFGNYDKIIVTFSVATNMPPHNTAFSWIDQVDLDKIIFFNSSSILRITRRAMWRTQNELMIVFSNITFPEPHFDASILSVSTDVTRSCGLFNSDSELYIMANSTGSEYCITDTAGLSDQANSSVIGLGGNWGQRLSEVTMTAVSNNIDAGTDYFGAGTTLTVDVYPPLSAAQLYMHCEEGASVVFNLSEFGAGIEAVMDCSTYDSITGQETPRLTSGAYNCVINFDTMTIEEQFVCLNPSVPPTSAPTQDPNIFRARRQVADGTTVSVGTRVAYQKSLLASRFGIRVNAAGTAFVDPSQAEAMFQATVRAWRHDNTTGASFVDISRTVVTETGIGTINGYRSYMLAAINSAMLDLYPPATRYFVLGDLGTTPQINQIGATHDDTGMLVQLQIKFSGDTNVPSDQADYAVAKSGIDSLLEFRPPLQDYAGRWNGRAELVIDVKIEGTALTTDPRYASKRVPDIIFKDNTELIGATTTNTGDACRGQQICGTSVPSNWGICDESERSCRVSGTYGAINVTLGVVLVGSSFVDDKNNEAGAFELWWIPLLVIAVLILLWLMYRYIKANTAKRNADRQLKDWRAKMSKMPDDDIVDSKPPSAPDTGEVWDRPEPAVAMRPPDPFLAMPPALRSSSSEPQPFGASPGRSVTAPNMSSLRTHASQSTKRRNNSVSPLEPNSQFRPRAAPNIRPPRPTFQGAGQSMSGSSLPGQGGPAFANRTSFPEEGPRRSVPGLPVSSSSPMPNLPPLRRQLSDQKTVMPVRLPTMEGGAGQRPPMTKRLSTTSFQRGGAVMALKRTTSSDPFARPQGGNSDGSSSVSPMRRPSMPRRPSFKQLGTAVPFGASGGQKPGPPGGLPPQTSSLVKSRASMQMGARPSLPGRPSVGSVGRKPSLPLPTGIAAPNLPRLSRPVMSPSGTSGTSLNMVRPGPPGGLPATRPVDPMARPGPRPKKPAVRKNQVAPQ